MATPTIKTQNYIAVVVADANDKETTWNIDNPRNDLNLTAVESALGALWYDENSSGVNWLFNSDGMPITTFKRAAKETVTRVTEILD